MPNIYNSSAVVLGGGAELPIDNGMIYEGKYRVRYYDIDGTILKIEYVAEGGNLTPPNNPTYDPDYLIFDKWNYDIENYVVEQPTDVGAIYNTVDAATYMFCRFTTNTGMNPLLRISGFTYIDWGDGTVDTNVSHIYNAEGNYIIKIYGNISFTTSSSKYLLGNNKELNRALQKCYIKNGVTSIEIYAFYDCFSLTSISIPNSVTSIGNYAFAYCYSLRSITIPDSITNISNQTFYFCYSLTSITIPNSVTIIGTSAFYTCASLTSITIPNSVTIIESYAFAYCYSLTNYFINCDTIPTLSNASAFSSNNQSTIMWIKESIITQLKVATNWSTYAAYMKPQSWYPSLNDPNA